MVFDPVLRSSSGRDLVDFDGFAVVKDSLLPLVRVVTPNLTEAAALSGRPVEKAEDVPRAAEDLGARYPGLNVVVTGGHLPTPDDYLLEAGGRGVWIEGERIEARLGRKTGHGTGCAFSTALAVFLGAGAGMEAAVRAAKEYVAGALRNAPAIGRGRGPLAHFWRVMDSSE